MQSIDFFNIFDIAKHSALSWTLFLACPGLFVQPSVLEYCGLCGASLKNIAIYDISRLLLTQGCVS